MVWRKWPEHKLLVLYTSWLWLPCNQLPHYPQLWSLCICQLSTCYRKVVPKIVVLCYMGSKSNGSPWVFTCFMVFQVLRLFLFVSLLSFLTVKFSLFCSITSGFFSSLILSLSHSNVIIKSVIMFLIWSLSFLILKFLISSILNYETLQKYSSLLAVKIFFTYFLIYI